MKNDPASALLAWIHGFRRVSHNQSSARGIALMTGTRETEGSVC